MPVILDLIFLAVVLFLIVRYAYKKFNSTSLEVKKDELKNISEASQEVQKLKSQYPDIDKRKKEVESFLGKK
jgi:large-conductance mechanosensitive channel